MRGNGSYEQDEGLDHLSRPFGHGSQNVDELEYLADGGVELELLDVLADFLDGLVEEEVSGSRYKLLQLREQSRLLLLYFSYGIF